MIKKLFSFIFCLAPIGALAEPTSYKPADANGTIDFPTGITIGASDNTAIIENGGTSANPYVAKGITVGTAGVNVANMIVGAEASAENGYLYIAPDTAAASTGFSIVTDGAFTVANLLQINAGQNLAVSTQRNEANPTKTFNVNVGNGTGVAIENNGTLAFTNVGAFVSNGAIRNTSSAGALDIDAVSMKSGAIENQSGTMTIGHLDGDGNIIMTGGLDMTGGTIVTSNNAVATNIAAGSIQNVSDIQNNAGTMDVKLSGNLTATGVIENKGGPAMNITAGGNIIAGGAMTNESGSMVINAAGLTINGTDANNHNASFVNKGNLIIDVTGATVLTNGFDLSAMGQDNTFSLATGTLNVGGNENWLQLFSNKLKQFSVVVRDGDLNLATDIVNGVSDGVANAAANMTISAQNIAANSVTNSGANLNITATGSEILPARAISGGNITIADGVTGNSGVTNISAAGTLDVGGAVVNNTGSEMNLSGEKGVIIASVTNSGTAHISSLTSPDGNIEITGPVTNKSGSLLIDSREIVISGKITNEDGSLSIFGSDNNSGAVTLGAVDAAGGVMRLNSLIGSIVLNGDLAVTGGALNIGVATTDMNVTGAVRIDGDVTLSADEALGAGNVNIGGSGNQKFVLSSTNGMTIAGGVSATQSDFARTVQFVADNIDVTKDVAAKGLGNIIFGNSSSNNTVIHGDVTANKDSTGNVGVVEFYGNQTSVGSIAGDGKFIAHGNVISATKGDINIEDTIWFNNQNPEPATGLIVKDTNELTLTTANGGNDILVGGINIAAGRTLNLTSARNVTVDGFVTNNGKIGINATSGNAKIEQDITVDANTGVLEIDAATIEMANLTNNNIANLNAAGSISAGAVYASGGEMDITADTMTASALGATGGVANIDVRSVTVGGPITVTGNMIQGGTDGKLNFSNSVASVSGASLNVTGDFNAKSGQTTYSFANSAKITGNIDVSGNAGVTLSARDLTTSNITNRSYLNLTARNGIVADSVINAAEMILDSGLGITDVDSIMSSGFLTLAGAGLSTDAALNQNILRQNYMGTMTAYDINVASNSYAITAPNVNVAGIAQESGSMVLHTSDLTVGGDISATDLRVAANPDTNWLNVNVGRNISGATKFIGLEHMYVGGNYTYDSASQLMMPILPYATGAGSTIHNYWAKVSLADDNTLGQITNRPNAEPLISVNGTFITNLDNNFAETSGALADGQMGIQIFDMINPGTAIWLLHANGGIQEDGAKIRNVNVKFCNADGTKCFDYFGPAETFNNSGQELPAYLSVRDENGDGKSDSLYIVFDPRFGGPVRVFKIQPIVGREENHTKGEYVSAGALDDLIEGQLWDAKFYNNTPIEAIPVAFAGTNMEEMSKELFKRLEYYNVSRDGAGLARFSRLFQPREVEQLAGSVVLNEHTSFRDFEDHMLDEFIWNRNRNLRKAWGEFDFGMFNQRVADSKRVSGNRFSFVGGYDWQESDTLILGLTGRVSHMSGDNKDDVNLGYLPGQFIAGNVKVDVSDTNFGIGGYLLKTLGSKMRLYGNAFLDLHWLDVSRDQTYVASIDGDGTAFSLISEWGLMHDLLNQYFVGNAYARIGYNFGLSLTEKAQGRDYMKIKSDGYMILTPGYSLIAQKRIYPSAWFQIRPYASIGVEYDVLGAPDSLKYKFAAAKHFTDYDVDIDPLWANIGGGMEFLSATGVQVGLDYRYQYNSDIQMHKIKLSGSYRF